MPTSNSDDEMIDSVFILVIIAFWTFFWCSIFLRNNTLNGFFWNKNKIIKKNKLAKKGASENEKGSIMSFILKIVGRQINLFLKQIINSLKGFKSDNEQVIKCRDMTKSISIRPPLIPEKDVECSFRNNPEGTLRKFQNKYKSSAFRFSNSSGKVTVALVDQNMATCALRNRNLNFYEASYQSKIRFGLSDLVKNATGALKLSDYFRKGLMGSKVMKGFNEKMTKRVCYRLDSFVADLKMKYSQQNHKDDDKIIIKMGLSELSAKVLFAANVDTLFGTDVYSQGFYEDFILFCKSIGYRSAPSASKKSNINTNSSNNSNIKSNSNSNKKEEEVRIIEEARERLLCQLRIARTSSTSQNREGKEEGFEASDIIKTLVSKLGASEDEADIAALLLLWGSNINTLPSFVWIAASILKNRGIFDALIQERRKIMKSCSDLNLDDEEDDLTSRVKRRTGAGDNNSGANKMKSLQHADRPLLSSCVAEGLRLYSRPNMYRVAMIDCSIKVNESGVSSSNLSSSCPLSVDIKKGEWVWLFPRLYLHHNPEIHVNPEEFRPFERFSNDNTNISCTVKKHTKGLKNTTTNQKKKSMNINNPSIFFKSSCPFHASNTSLKVFGGGTAPCPGKDYGISMMKTSVDQILLSGVLDIKLAVDGCGDNQVNLPPQINDGVSSTPPPARDIEIEVLVC